MARWKPDEWQLEWTRNFIAKLADNAIWGTTFAVYEIDKKNKTISILTMIGSGPEYVEMRKRTSKVFKLLGWKTKKKSISTVWRGANL